MRVDFTGSGENTFREGLYGTDVTPIDDVRSTAEYRRRVVANLVADWIGHLDR